jgi:hypothetical protein
MYVTNNPCVVNSNVVISKGFGGSDKNDLKNPTINLIVANIENTKIKLV